MREMLRIKRSVQAMYNTQVNMMSAQMLNNTSNSLSDVPADAMRLLDSKTQGIDFNFIINYYYICSILINFNKFYR